MKKLTSILCALVIALSASGASHFKPRTQNVVKDVTAIQNHVKKIAAKTPAKASGEVINIEADNLSIDDTYNAMYLQYLGYGYVEVAGGNDEWEVEAVLYPESANYFTTYSTEAYDIELSVYDAEENEIELAISSAELKKLEKGSQFTATGTDEDGNTYNIDLKFIIPDEPKSTVNLDFGEVKQGKFYAEDGDWYFYAERADYVVQLDIYTAELAGDYDLDDLYARYCGLYAIQGEDTTSVGDFFSAAVNISLNEGVYTIAADLFMTDTILYKVNMTYTKPLATDTIEYTFQEPVSLDDFGGDWYFRAADTKYILSVDYYSTTCVGEFGLADMYADYVGLRLINGTDTTFVGYEDIKVVVTEAEAQYDIKVTYLGSDLHCYIFTLHSMKAVAEETVQIELENAQYQDISDYSWYYGFSHYVLAAPADSSVVFALAIKNTEFIGDFTEADLYASYTAVWIGEDYYAIASAEFSVAAGANGSYVLTGWLLAKNNVKYEFVITTQEEEATAIDNTNAAVKAVKRVVNGQVVIEKNGVLFNILGSEIK